MPGTGAVAEWLNAHDSKSCIGATLSRVQIPSAPPEITPACAGCFYSNFAISCARLVVLAIGAVP